MTVLILASSSPTRAAMLRNAGISFEVQPARVDEETIRQSLEAEGAKPRDIADALAEHKALKIARKFPDAIVLGCDQILSFEGRCLGKPETREAAAERLRLLRGTTHSLHTAAVLYVRGEPIWRHVSEAKLTMREFSESYLSDYLENAGSELTSTVGGYAVEGLGIRLFESIEGDHFGILGLPLLELLNLFARRGDFPA